MGIRWLGAAGALLALLGSSSLHGAIQVELQGPLSDELRHNVEAFLVLKRRADQEELPDAVVRRLYGKAEHNIRQALRPFGYYDPRVSGRLTHTQDGWVAVFDIDPGQAVILEEADIEITGEGRTDPEFVALLKDSGLVTGQPVRHDRYDAFKSRLVELAAQRGYFEADFTRRELAVDPARFVAAAHLHFDTGPRYRLGEIRIEQDFLADDIVMRGIDLQQDEYFDATRLRNTEYKLFDLGHFSLVDIETEPDPETRQVPVTIWLTPTRRYRWTFGGGFSTDSKLFLRIGVQDRLVNRRGHRMGLNLRLSQPKQDLLYRYVIPTGKPLETFTILTGFTRELRGDTISNRFEIAPIDSRFWGAWRRDLFVIAQAENSDIAGFTFNDVMLIPGIRAIRTRWNELVRPTEGSKIATELRGSSTAIGSGTDYAQAHVRSAFYVPLRSNLRLYLRGEIGATAVSEFPELPASQRFFAGGDRSVRGFALNSLSPRNAQGELVGGRNLLFGSVELEYDAFPKWIITPFVDVGNAFDAFGDPLEYSAGLGFRWQSPIGLVGIDVAQPLSEPGLGPRLHLSIRPEL